MLAESDKVLELPVEVSSEDIDDIIISNCRQKDALFKRIMTIDLVTTAQQIFWKFYKGDYVRVL